MESGEGIFMVSVDKSEKDDACEEERNATAQAQLAVARPISTVPEIAQGYEEVYNRFINGKLIFDNKNGQRKEFLFSQFAATLDGEFDLSDLTYKDGNSTYNVNESLRIKVGYRTTQENDRKVTVWFTPRFLVENSNCQWKSLDWRSPMGLFWSYGNWGLEDFNYETVRQFDKISSKNLFALGADSATAMTPGSTRALVGGGVRAGSLFLPKF
jgi:hypothetical protein